MARQLVLLDSRTTDWKLDDATRTTGKRGIAAARAALAAVTREADDHSRDTAA
jgi:hypothetical protein